MVALGYEGEVIKQYFLNLFSANCDLKVKLVTGSVCDVDIKALYAFHKQHGRLATNKRLEGSMGLSVAGW